MRSFLDLLNELHTGTFEFLGQIREDVDVAVKVKELDFLQRVYDYTRLADDNLLDQTGLLVFLKEKMANINFDLSFWEPITSVCSGERVTMAVYDGAEVYKAHGRRDDVSSSRVVLAFTRKCAFESVVCPPYIESWIRRGFVDHVRPDLVRQLIEVVNSRREKKLSLKRNVESLEYMLYCDDKLTHTVQNLADVWCIVSPLMDYREVTND